MSKKRKLELPSSSMTGGVWPTTTCAGSASISASRVSGCRDRLPPLPVKTSQAKGENQLNGI